MSSIETKMALFLKISTLPLPLKSFQLCRTLPTNSLVYSKRSFSVLSQRHYEGNILPTAPGLSNLRTLSTGSSVAQDYLSASTSVFGWMANLPLTVFVQGKKNHCEVGSKHEWTYRKYTEPLYHSFIYFYIPIIFTYFYFTAPFG